MNTFTQDIVDFICKMTTRVEADQSWTPAIDQALLRREEREGYVSRAFNPSSLCNGCMVQDAFKRLHDMWGDAQGFSPQALRLFAAGHAVHDHFQSVILPEITGDVGRLWGLWRCMSCHQVVEGFRPEEVCTNTVAYRDADGVVHENNCDRVLARERVRWRYEEIRIRRPDPKNRGDAWMIRGRADGIWIKPTGHWRVLEMKSKERDQFDSMSRVRGKEPGTFVLKPRQGPLPLEKDTYQGKLYPAILVEQGRQGIFPLDPDLCEGTSLLYLDRDRLADRAYEIAYDPDFLPMVVDPYIDSVHRLVELGQPLAGPKACSSRNTAKAKRCRNRLDCFPYKRTKKKKTPAHG